MAITYTWEIKALSKSNGNNLNDVIIGTRWECTGTDSDGVSGTFVGATPFSINSVNPESFVEYSQLDEETVLGWIKNTVSGSNKSTNYWDHISERIQKAIDNKKGSIQNVDVFDLPWAPTSGSNSGSKPI